MDHDILIIGGGINGTAIAREAALLGQNVLLVERDDLASATSSASTKLIHGGLRYLEYYAFRLVREALKERERLLAAAPHLIRPMRFALPHAEGLRPWWLVRLGLMLYDRLGGRLSLPRSRGWGDEDGAIRAPLKQPAVRGFLYSDAWVDDARLVVLNARDAADNGATIATHTAFAGARRVDGGWQAELSDGRTVTARAIINAAGPWVAQALGLAGVRAAAGVRLVKGSHIIVPAQYRGDHAYMLQQPDRRIVFAIPYLDDKLLIGTTDVPVERPGDARIDEAEIDYLLGAANRWFAPQIGRADIIATYSGVRALYDDGAGEARAVTRDYVLELDAAGAPILSVFGGKITTARQLAEDAVAKLAPAMGIDACPVTRARALPGGYIASFGDFLGDIRTRYPFLGEARAERMARAYGSLLYDMLGEAADEATLGEDLGGGLTALEVDWLATREWASNADDILWRRTKLGLTAPDGTADRIARHLAERHPAATVIPAG